MCNLVNTHTLSKNCRSRESVSPLSRLIRGFRNKYHWDQCEWHRMTRMTGPDCAVMYVCMYACMYGHHI